MLYKRAPVCKCYERIREVKCWQGHTNEHAMDYVGVLGSDQAAGSVEVPYWLSDRVLWGSHLEETRQCLASATTRAS